MVKVNRNEVGALRAEGVVALSASSGREASTASAHCESTCGLPPKLDLTPSEEDAAGSDDEGMPDWLREAATIVRNISSRSSSGTVVAPTLEPSSAVLEIPRPKSSGPPTPPNAMQFMLGDLTSRWWTSSSYISPLPPHLSPLPSASHLSTLSTPSSIPALASPSPWL